MKKRIRLSIKLSSFTVLMVVVSMLASFYLIRSVSIVNVSAWVFIFSVISLGVGLLHTLFLDRNITLPIQTLSGYTARMVDMDYREPVPIRPSDEIGVLAESIDALRVGFLTKRRSLQELNEQLDAKVAERTGELEMALNNLRQAQEELLKVEKLASIGRLAGGVAHEINNPCGIILTRTGMLLELGQDQPWPAELMEGLGVIDRQVKRIARITGDLLVFSRMSPLARKGVHVAEVLKWSLKSYQQRARESGVEMSCEGDTNVWVVGDVGGLEQVFGNLIKNALDAMEESGGRVACRTEVDGDRVRVIVRDTGPGIPTEIVTRILDPFFTTKKVGKGTGLGLAISYGIVAELGGTLEPGNHPEGGAQFVVTLSRATPETPGSGAIMPGWEGVLS